MAGPLFKGRLFLFMKRIIILLSVCLLFSCQSVQDQELRPRPVMGLSPTKFSCDETYLAFHLERLSSGKWQHVKQDIPEKLEIRVTESLDLPRSKSPKMLGNIFTILVGHFYFSYNFESEVKWQVAIQKNSKTEFIELKNSLKSSYSGYLPEYKPGLEKRNLFYQDQVDRERDVMGLKAAHKILQTYQEK